MAINPEALIAFQRAIRGTPQFQELDPLSQAELAASGEVDRLSEPLARAPREVAQELSGRERTMAMFANMLSHVQAATNPNTPFVDQINALVEERQAEADRTNEDADLRFSDARDQRQTDLRLAERRSERATDERRTVSDRQFQAGQAQTEAARRRQEQAADQAHDLDLVRLRGRLERENIELNDRLRRGREKNEINAETAGAGVALANAFFNGGQLADDTNPDGFIQITPMREEILAGVEAGQRPEAVLATLEARFKRMIAEAFPSDAEEAAAVKHFRSNFQDALNETIAQLPTGPQLSGDDVLERKGSVSVVGGDQRLGTLADKAAERYRKIKLDDRGAEETERRRFLERLAPDMRRLVKKRLGLL